MNETDQKIIDALELVYPPSETTDDGIAQLIYALECLGSGGTDDRFQSLVDELTEEALKHYCWQLAKQLLEPKDKEGESQQ